MARKAERLKQGTIVFDCQALSLLLRGSRDATVYLDRAHSNDFDVVVSSMTVIEARDNRVKAARLNWVLSTLVVQEVTADIAREASDLLCATGLHGHRHAIDAVVAVTAMREPGPSVLVTSDPEDMRRLCDGSRVVIDAI